jgi:hypothetical protein
MLPKSHFSIEGAITGTRLRIRSRIAERLIGKNAPEVNVSPSRLSRWFEAAHLNQTGELNQF